MISFNRRMMIGTSAVALLAAATPALAQDSEQPADDGAIVVTGLAIAEDEPASATGLSLTLRETPQSVTVIDNQRIQDFALTNTGKLLEQVVGLNVQRYDSDRTMFTARGFDVSNVQIDGIGSPLRFNIQFGELDTLFYERIEVIRGASGLTTGVGNPSATINYIRKRPTRERSLYLGGYAGSYDAWRVEADANVPLDADGDIAFRVVGAHDQRKSHMFNYDNTRNLAGGILSAQITPDLKATAGYTYQHNLSHGAGWSSVIHHYSDGTRIQHERDVNFAPPWAFWKVMDEQAFGELAWSPGGSDWKVRAIVSMKRAVEDQALLYVGFGNPNRTTGIGPIGFASQYQADYMRWTGDLTAAGPFTLFGREHELTLGGSWTQEDGRQWSNAAQPVTFPVAVPDFRNFRNVHVPRPTSFGPKILQLDEVERQARGYIATRLNPADWLKLIVGTSYSHYKVTGVNYSVPTLRDNKEFNPYAGILIDPIDNVTLYASYTSTFNPQGEVDANRVRLQPIRGSNIEAGIKSELLNKRLYLAATLFRTRQDGLAELVGSSVPPADFYLIYRPVDVTATGFEIELAGHLTAAWQISGGYTGLRIEDKDGKLTRTYQPRQSLKLSTNYRFVDLNNLTIGAQLRWQGDTYAAVAALPGVELRQEAYAVFDLMAGIDIDDTFRASINLANVTDKFYITSMAAAASDMGNFAPGRNFTVSLSAKF
ncbi:TonB-dependent siderophore receptor [Sphingomonas sp. MG17]|jgi:outer membrane receptor for ferric coprogen and ferric-rhodotorulic acid|uniref:TonB-dependent siderophore receptor n=1 Tax=Sphingomonas tagetis TaxID=2949092 RepID=A0A9X2HR93_9SPHN|nr:TonB-dependent siderophore receptor [Sphingomonas tagetis]MCP3731135.1 TonB-dependent siderophore receptor [Sphingomonas tagetis]